MEEQTKPPEINIPEIDGIQSVKGLVKIKPHGTEESLTLVNSEFRYLPIKESDNRQLWWVVQDYHYHTFALVNNASSQWLYYDPSTNSLMTTTNDKKTSDDPLLGEYLERQYFFEFETFDSISHPNKPTLYAIRSFYSKKDLQTNKYLPKTKYLQTTHLDSESSNWRLGIGEKTAGNALYFDLEEIKGFSGGVVPLPMSETEDHTQQKVNGLLSIQAKRPITDNKAYLSSSYGFLLNLLGGKEMFTITFDDSVTESVVGLLHYRAALFRNAFFQKEGSRKPIAGIGVKEDKTKKRGYVIYLFNKDNTVDEADGYFIKGEPIVFGYKRGDLIASQEQKDKTEKTINIKLSITGVPTPVLLNSTNGNKIRLLMHLPQGGVSIGYNPNIIVFGNDFSRKDETPFIMTNPYLSNLKVPERKNPAIFDWMRTKYTLTYEDSEGRTVEGEMQDSPFYSNELEFRAIAAKYISDETGVKKYKGGEDFEYYDGWELITHDFGNSEPEKDPRREPYMILYNLYTSTLRVFVYIKNDSIANNLKISLSDGPKTRIVEEYRSARLWGSYLQGRALKKSDRSEAPDLSTNEYSKTIQLKSTGRKFYFADFTLSYDPCVSQYESNLLVIIAGFPLRRESKREPLAKKNFDQRQTGS